MDRQAWSSGLSGRKGQCEVQPEMWGPARRSPRTSRVGLAQNSEEPKGYAEG